MYAEDKRFFPDDTRPTLEAADSLWSSYSERAQLGDKTFWGSRPRLRCVKSTLKTDKPELVKPSEALRCMELVNSEPIFAHCDDRTNVQPTLFRAFQVIGMQ